MRRVLYIGGFEMPDKNAAAQRVIANAMTLREIGFDVAFIGPTKNRDSTVSMYNGFKCDYIDYPRSVMQWGKYIATFVPPKKILEYNPDYVILYNFPALASFKILKYCHKRGIKVIHDLTEWEASIGWSLREIIRKIDINFRMRYCTKRMDGVIAISRYLYDYYSRFTKTILVPPTVDLTDTKFDRGRQLTANSPIQLIYAGSVGAGNKDKLDYVIRCISKVHSLKLTIVGMTIDQYMSVYGPLPKGCMNVEFRGRVSHKEAVKLVCASDFQVLIRENTLKNMAGFPTKFVESMSCCTPLIATISSNICDYLVNGENGYLVNDYESLTDLLNQVSCMEIRDLIRMKEKCRDFEVFDYRNYKEEFLKLFA